MLLLFGERSADKHGDGTPEVAACRPVTSRSDADRQSFVVAVTLATYTLTSATYVLAAESGRLVGHELGAVGVRSARCAETAADDCDTVVVVGDDRRRATAVSGLSA